MSSLIEQVEVRRRLATDLAVLRSLTRALLQVAHAAEQDERQRSLICDVLARLCSEANRHFAYEEEMIGPILRDVDAWGPVRVEQLYSEHEQQRRVLSSLANDAEAPSRNVGELAGEIEWFFDRFERLISDEEDGLLNAESLGAEPYVDQIDG
jgi:iron-sulfur cluster repair protein YtfE (RIC family)